MEAPAPLSVRMWCKPFESSSHDSLLTPAIVHTDPQQLSVKYQLSPLHNRQCSDAQHERFHDFFCSTRCSALGPVAYRPTTTTRQCTEALRHNQKLGASNRNPPSQDYIRNPARKTAKQKDNAHKRHRASSKAK